MGGKKVMIRLSVSLDVKEVIEEKRKVLNELFTEFQPWAENYAVQSRSIWLRISGIPYEAWETSNFSKIGSLFGEFLGVHPDTMNGSNFESSRVLVETNNFQIIREEIEVKLGGKISKVFVWEEGSFKEPSLESSDEVCSIKNSNLEDGKERKRGKQTNGEDSAEGYTGGSPTQDNQELQEEAGSTWASKLVAVEKTKLISGQTKDMAEKEMKPVKEKQGNNSQTLESEDELLSDEESFGSLGKIQNYLKLVKRREAKNKEIVKYYRKNKKGKQCQNLDRQARVEKQKIPKVMTEEVEESEEDGEDIRVIITDTPQDRADDEKQRVEDEATYRCARRLGISWAGDSDPTIFINHLKDMRKERN